MAIHLSLFNYQKCEQFDIIFHLDTDLPLTTSTTYYISFIMKKLHIKGFNRAPYPIGHQTIAVVPAVPTQPFSQEKINFEILV
jgi:hypothetical protein